ncbi:C45 family autoproteolytic acyltransferase/hydolase [Streptomyces cavernicola]|uniref:C45 family autoproteolytic acyltransferase/hydrolase n=1 Tax=Streptomyces cavernicola TaxID=3043613 RepID=A0ABT6SB26_9ACTN|nr:C45 family peptidase [Streptomyces sp. B-S-A6]MDI3405159.1 C45 family autoproteolytic acyltransferase/hydrolase [Streptomyces sp. B-S-A6]
MTSPDTNPDTNPSALPGRVEHPIDRPAERLHIAVDAPDAFARGAARGERLRATLPGGIAGYDRFFELGGISPQQARDDAERALDVVGAFRPQARAEIEGIAHGAGVDTWRVAALNARTEILARSSTVPPGECSTIVRRLARPDMGEARTFGIQTWDWHVKLNPFWHTLESRGGAHDFVGITEHGILAKIGVNSAGLALHFNILGHRADGVGGIPMHVLAALVLEEAGSVREALELIRSAPVASSGSFSLFDPDEAVLLDLSPDGVFPVDLAPEHGTLVRTNHFLTPTPAAQEKSWLYQPDSGRRYDLIRDRLAASTPPATPDDLVAFLRSGAGEAPLTCIPDMSLPQGERWAGLATVILEPAARTARVLDGTPVDADTRPWRRLSA